MSSNGIDHGLMNRGPMETREIRPRNANDPIATTQHNGQWYSWEEARELQRRESAIHYNKKNREKWEQTPQGQLCLTFYKAFQEYKNYMEENSAAIFTPLGP